MTVQSLLKNMDQTELCHWIAYHKMEREEHNKDKQDGPDKEPDSSSKKPKLNVVVKDGVSQKQKDDLLLQQLCAIAHHKKHEKD